MKDSFVFRKEWRDAVSGMSAEMRLEFYEAVIEYATTGNEPNLKPMARLAFNFAKATLDKDAESYERICERNRKNGKNGGRPRNPVGFLETQDNPNNPVGFLETQKSGGFLERETEQEKESPVVSFPTPLSSLPLEKEKEKDRESFDFSEQKFADMRKLFEKRKAKFIESVEPYVTIYGKEMTDAFISYWTEPNKSHTKMRHELERTWDVSRRLSTWASRDRSHEAPMARAKRVVEEQARKAREERQSSTDELMRKRDQWTKQAVSLEEARNSEEYKRAMAEA